MVNNFHFLPALETQTEKASEGELALLHSELWSSLFRGGYRVGKLQRSLSGYYVCRNTLIKIEFCFPYNLSYCHVFGFFATCLLKLLGSFSDIESPVQFLDLICICSNLGAIFVKCNFKDFEMKEHIQWTCSSKKGIIHIYFSKHYFFIVTAIGYRYLFLVSLFCYGMTHISIVLGLKSCRFWSERIFGEAY